MLAAAEAAVAIDVTDFEVEFVDTSGCRCRAPLSASWPARFEDVGPVRGFRWSKGQCHWPGWWWSATSGRHVGYESWLERDHVMLLDFDRDVVVSPRSRFGCTGATSASAGMPPTFSHGCATAPGW